MAPSSPTAHTSFGPVPHTERKFISGVIALAGPADADAAGPGSPSPPPQPLWHAATGASATHANASAERRRTLEAKRGRLTVAWPYQTARELDKESALLARD